MRVQGSGKRGRIAGEKPLAPRTIRNVYSVCSALFRDAATEGLIEQTPCILSRAQLPKVKDADPTWRATAIFLPAEVESLISDERIPRDRRVCYALYFLGCTRFGDMSALHWRAYDPNRAPLASLRVELSYNTRAKQEKGVKTDNPRTVPVHPTLARILGEWKLSGWPQMFKDKKPLPDDLIVPSRLGKNRSANHLLKRFHEDCARLARRSRRDCASGGSMTADAPSSRSRSPTAPTANR